MGPQFERVVGHQRSATGHRFHHRDVVTLGKGSQPFFGQRPVDPPAGHDERSLRSSQCSRRSAQLAGVRAGGGVSRGRPRRNKREGKSKASPWTSWGEADEGRAAVPGVEHYAEGVRQRLNQLLRRGDAVPMADDRLEGVVDGQRRVAKVLHLLKHRVRDAAVEGIAGQQKQRHPVGHGHRGRGHHVGGTGADGAGGGHDAAAAVGLGVGHRGQRHALLVSDPARWAAPPRPAPVRGPSR